MFETVLIGDDGSAQARDARAVLVVGAGGASRGRVMARGVLARAGDEPPEGVIGEVDLLAATGEPRCP